MNILNQTVVCLTAIMSILGAGAVDGQGLTPGRTRAAVTETLDESLSDYQIVAAQRMLRKIGFFSGKVSGILDGKTSMACSNFAKEVGIPFNGEVSENFIRSLRNYAWKMLYAEFEDQQEKFLSVDELKILQEYLADLGYVPGPIDGTFGPQTMSAIETFQSDLSIFVDGAPTRDILISLDRAVNSSARDATSTVRVLNWSDYMSPEFLLNFEEKYGVRVIYDVYGSDEELLQRLAETQVPYDVVIGNAQLIPDLISNGDIGKVVDLKLTDSDNIDANIRSLLRNLDPDNQYSIPFMWGTVGIAYNTNRLRSSGVDLQGFDIGNILDPAKAKKIKCGIGIVDDPNEVVSLVAMYNGFDPTFSPMEMFPAVERTLAEIQPFTNVVSVEEYIDQLSSGKICAAIMYSGDAIQAQDGSEDEILYKVPEMGSSLWFDSVMVGKQSLGNMAVAQFFSELLQPEKIAGISEFTGYANANTAAGAFMSRDLLNNPAIYPQQSVMDKLIVRMKIGEAAQRETDRLWTSFSE